MIKIIDYKAGNAPSVAHAINRLGKACQLINSADGLNGASHIILPGVGSAKATMESLRELGILPALKKEVLENKVPFLGICVGMQVLFEHSDEGDVKCLGWLKGRVVKFDSNLVRVPQMGYNKVVFSKTLITQKDQSDYFYFVNSYYVKPSESSDIWATANYGSQFCCAVNSGNIYGTQFHVEKSGEAGLGLLQSFLKERLFSD